MESIISNECRLCPRNCGVDRAAGVIGHCGAGSLPVVAGAQPHYWEEPCISGRHGSGTVFFSGCSLKCVYCQNYEISASLVGREVNVTELRDIFKRLEDMGVHNINLVNPTHFAVAILEALERPPSIPIVYNSGGYERLETLRAFEGKISIYLPDFKYSDNRLAEKYSGVSDYYEYATQAITEMVRQTGDYVLDSDGVLTRGVLIRHLVLPGNIQNSRNVIKWIDDHFENGNVLFSLMSQYTPHGRAVDYGALGRRLTRNEYDEVEAYLLSLDFDDGYLQDLGSAGNEYIPPFDLTPI